MFCKIEYPPPLLNLNLKVPYDLYRTTAGMKCKGATNLRLTLNYFFLQLKCSVYISEAVLLLVYVSIIQGKGGEGKRKILTKIGESSFE